MAKTLNEAKAVYLNNEIFDALFKIDFYLSAVVLRQIWKKPCRPCTRCRACSVGFQSVPLFSPCCFTQNVSYERTVQIMRILSWANDDVTKNDVKMARAH